MATDHTISRDISAPRRGRKARREDRDAIGPVTGTVGGLIAVAAAILTFSPEARSLFEPKSGPVAPATQENTVAVPNEIAVPIECDPAWRDANVNPVTLAHAPHLSVVGYMNMGRDRVFYVCDPTMSPAQDPLDAQHPR